MSFPKRLKETRIKAGLSQENLAIACEWEGRARISNYENGTRSPRPKDVEKLAKVLKVSPQWLQFGEGSDNGVFWPKKDVKFLKKIPTIPLDEVEAWLSGRLTKTVSTMNFISHSHEFDFGNNIFFVEIKGDSMISPNHPEDSYAEGDFALVDPDAKHDEGKTVLFSQNNAIKIRKISSDGNELILKANNSQYPIIKLDETVKILGVILLTQRNRMKQSSHETIS